ncbi:MAG: hypothetical protein JWP63_6309, partial [Candidatus Solibacter sp.]|nr:hypothetical protein [Candidatus Solibacter sp.]
MLGWELVALFFARPTAALSADAAPFRMGIVFCAAAAIAACALKYSRARQAAFVAAVAGMFAVGVWMLRTTPPPVIDVYIFHQDGSAALYSGKNPYEIRSRNIYGQEESQRVYGPGISVNGQLTFGFPYPPVSLLISSLGYLVAGDCRYAHLAAICAATLLMAYARPSRLSFVAALLFLFTPRAFFVLEQNWTEPVIVFLLAVTVFCRCRFPRVAPWMTGILLAGKQYLIFAAPALLRKWSEVPKAAIAAAVVTAPLALWNFTEFFRSTVTVQMVQPVRLDALSYMAQLCRYDIRMPGWIAFVLTAAAIVFVVRKAAPTTTASCSGVAFIMIVFFVFNKNAFCNYYYFVIGALACAIATAETKPPSHV